MTDPINAKHDIYPPSELCTGEDAEFHWPLLWGAGVECGDDPCDELPWLTECYLLRRCREDRAPKPEVTPIRWSPSYIRIPA